MNDRNGTELRIGDKVAIVAKKDGTDSNLRGSEGIIVRPLYDGKIAVDIDGLLYALPEEVLLSTVLPFTTHKFHVWDWVYFAGMRFRIVYPVGGNWKISDGVTSHTVHPSVLTPCLADADLEREFKDAYPQE